jgi:hypothetical protein
MRPGHGAAQHLARKHVGKGGRARAPKSDANDLDRTESIHHGREGGLATGRARRRHGQQPTICEGLTHDQLDERPDIQIQPRCLTQGAKHV